VNEIPIKDKKVSKVGNSYCFFIPKPLINNGIIDPDKTYDIAITTPGD